MEKGTCIEIDSSKKKALKKMGTRIRDKREEMGMSQAELARRAGYTNRSIETRIEKGEVDLTTSKIEKIANILDTTPGYLLGWESEEGEDNTLSRFYYIGNRIRSKREELGLSQEELKNKTGYSNRSMIARIERGDINITSSKIEAIAKALDTTPAYIMGWDEEESENERMARFYYRYEELSDLEQAMVRKIMNCDEDFNKLGK